MLMTILLVVQVLFACAMIGLILIQQGKGAATGAAFGSGASATVFGARGSASFLTRTTAILAILFFSNSFVLSYLYSHMGAPKSLMERVSSFSEPAKNGNAAKPGQVPGSDLPPAGPDSSTGAAAPAPAGQTTSAGEAAKPPEDLPTAPASPAPATQDTGDSAPKN